MKWKAGTFSISADWAAALDDIGLIKLGTFNQTELLEAEVPPVWHPVGRGRPAAPPDGAELGADAPDLLALICAVTRRAFVIGSWDANAGPRGETFRLPDASWFYGVRLTSGSDVLLVAIEGDSGWEYRLARPDVLADLLVAEFFRPRPADPGDPDQRERGTAASWTATWPEPGFGGDVHTHEVTILRFPTLDTATAVSKRNFGHRRVTTAVEIDAAGISDQFLQVLALASGEVSRRY